MRCLNPRTVGFLADGKTISWSSNKYSREYPSFKLPCSKCIECRLEYARQWAVRCVHEAKVHPENSFITLTYDNEHLEQQKLQYKHFQDFMKRLRYACPERKIGFFSTGEYGDGEQAIKNNTPSIALNGDIVYKRPHWHAITFNWQPKDLIYKYTNDRGDKLYSSETLDTLWGHGITEIGSVTFQSAGYCARYAAKKLVHGKDDEHEFHPISKKSSRHAIGKKFLELYWQDIFNYGKVILPDGKESAIPRYYEKWLHKNQPAAWEKYIQNIKQRRCENAALKSQTIQENYSKGQEARHQRNRHTPLITQSQHRKIIIDKKFKDLQSKLKGDI